MLATAIAIGQMANVCDVLFLYALTVVQRLH